MKRMAGLAAALALSAVVSAAQKPWTRNDWLHHPEVLKIKRLQKSVNGGLRRMAAKSCDEMYELKMWLDERGVVRRYDQVRRDAMGRHKTQNFYDERGRLRLADHSAGGVERHFYFNEDGSTLYADVPAGRVEVTTSVAERDPYGHFAENCLTDERADATLITPVGPRGVDGVLELGEWEWFGLFAGRNTTTVRKTRFEVRVGGADPDDQDAPERLVVVGTGPAPTLLFNRIEREGAAPVTGSAYDLSNESTGAVKAAVGGNRYTLKFFPTAFLVTRDELTQSIDCAGEWRLDWAGDIDGDEGLDFLISGGHAMGSGGKLFLSSRAKRGALVGLAGVYWDQAD